MTHRSLESLQLRARAALRELELLSVSGCADQRHLDAGSTERAYWHHGYHSAIIDLVKLLVRDSANPEAFAEAHGLLRELH